MSNSTTLEPNLARYLEIIEDRIEVLERELCNLQSNITSHASMKQSLVRQKEALLSVADVSPVVHLHNANSDQEEWIHINDSIHYPELPQPTTLRGWIRNRKLIEGTHYKRLGAKGKIYIELNAILRDWDSIHPQTHQE